MFTSNENFKTYSLTNIEMKHLSHSGFFFFFFLVTGCLELLFLTEVLSEAYINFQNMLVKAMFHFSSKIILKLQLHFMVFYSIGVLSFQEALGINKVECRLPVIGQRYK